MTAPRADVIIVGAGPAGRALAHRLLHRSVRVTLVDPAPHRSWRATYACWTDELPDWLPRGILSTSTSTARIRGHSVVDIDRGYGVLDNEALRRALPVDSAEVITGRATRVEAAQVELTSGERRSAPVVVDARGPAGAGPRQTAYGVVVPRIRAEEVLDGAAAVLMDWSAPAGGWHDGEELPSFLYAIPLDDQRVLLEETCLAGSPALTRSILAARLSARVPTIDIMTADDTETVSFALTGSTDKPWRSSPMTFGARGGLVHPATGYGVAAALSAADAFAAAIAAGTDPVTALWPRSARTIHRLRLAGMRALLDLPADDMRMFFDIFANLPVDHQRAFLSERTDLVRVAAAMTAVFRRVPNRTRNTLARAMFRR